jgi:hypothetical protein
MPHVQLTSRHKLATKFIDPACLEILIWHVKGDGLTSDLEVVYHCERRIRLEKFEGNAIGPKIRKGYYSKWLVQIIPIKRFDHTGYCHRQVMILTQGVAFCRLPRRPKTKNYRSAEIRSFMIEHYMINYLPTVNFVVTLARRSHGYLRSVNIAQFGIRKTTL